VCRDGTAAVNVADLRKLAAAIRIWTIDGLTSGTSLAAGIEHDGAPAPRGTGTGTGTTTNTTSTMTSNLTLSFPSTTVRGMSAVGMAAACREAAARLSVKFLDANRSDCTEHGMTGATDATGACACRQGDGFAGLGATAEYSALRGRPFAYCPCRQGGGFASVVNATTGVCCKTSGGFTGSLGGDGRCQCATTGGFTGVLVDAVCECNGAAGLVYDRAAGACVDGARERTAVAESEYSLFYGVATAVTVPLFLASQVEG